jgi:hypothetical protein
MCEPYRFKPQPHRRAALAVAANRKTFEGEDVP